MAAVRAAIAVRRRDCLLLVLITNALLVFTC
jgi:hypothetical protein